MFCPYCGSKKTDGVDVCPMCGRVDPEAPQGCDDSEDATRVINGSELEEIEKKMNQGTQPGMEWQQNVQQQSFQQQGMPQQSFQQQGMPQQSFQQQGMPQQSFQQQQGFYQGAAAGQPVQTEWENPQDDPRKKKKKKKSKKGLIIGLIIAAILLIGGGLTAFFLLRGGYSSPEAATEAALKAMSDKDAEAFADTLSDDMYDRLCDFVDDEDFDGSPFVGLKKTDGKAFKKSLINLLSTLYKSKIGDLNYEKLNYDYEIIDTMEMDDDDLDDFEETMDLYEDYDELMLVRAKITVSFNGEEDSEEIVDICYKEGGRWYSSMVIQTVAPALLRYVNKSSKSDDVAAAETINSACQAALANEDAYDEVADTMSSDEGTVIATAAEGEPFKSTGASGIKNNATVFLSELNSSVGGTAPKIKYKKEGAAYWTVGMNSSGRPVVWLGTSEGDTTWELQPEICPEYK